ncbi:methylenetetrahydrofolate reductase [Halomonas urmiana]|uniref:Methylenetetrahydrofolate reductase n=1 Tax=Halomonas urmiana TaxID=490901 RepID=A0A5R8MCW9_9GAMM|nr:methylenetetrahydrofolate reductase [Halomonas urmiana]TLF47355.1 methylenetetrahydrofolate reductase [Halomonas urmiana]
MNDLCSAMPPEQRLRGCLALARSRYELLPLADLQEAAHRLPPGAWVTVTCSPRHGIERTLEAAERLSRDGFCVVPHLAARLVRDHDHLEAIAARLSAAGIDDAFVVGGDAPRPAGDYANGLALLEALSQLPGRPARLGVPAYPEGHRQLDGALLQRDLEAKARIADYAVTQMCFESAPLLDWLRRQRAGGLALPVYAGIPGVIAHARLLSVALRIGLGPSTRALGRQRGLLGRLLRPAVYRPEGLMRGLWPSLEEPGGFAGLHVYSFNQVSATRAWLEALCASYCAGQALEPALSSSADSGAEIVKPAARC